MSIVCTVCRDPLTSNPVPGSEADWDGHRCSSLVARIVVTGCGHAQHEYCLTNWIQRSQSCPFCSANVSTADFRRIFPIGDEDIEEAQGPSPASREIAELRRQNVEKDKELTKLRQSVEKEQTEATKLRQAVEKEQTEATKLRQAVEKEQTEATKLRQAVELEQKEVAKLRRAAEEEHKELMELRRAAEEEEKELTELRLLVKEERLIADVLRVDNACLESKNSELAAKLAAESRTAELDVQVADCKRQISTLKRQLKAAVEENAATAKKISLLHKHSTQAQCLLDQLLDTNKHYRPNSTENTEPHDDGDVTVVDLGDTSTSCHYIPTPRKTTRLSVEEITVDDDDDAEFNHDSSSSYLVEVETTSSSSSIAED